ncbi:putative alpha crystallin/Hsp20 domain, HSP20-like chaperone [Helianthus annuus]|uniref:Alpha crystallin/Hsp20 domain, HSP20-like chaperone n=1 Tax=Helianthus annuus TaxID=4232 RepID=A0A251TG87_HELAN|nr:22.0 kDa heat shock protein [Helianthus annuus]KAF5783855.1 putative alpha crystallin/Hsp20 domain, HSP20-like chaperone [Helianthus annuus]KAJ0503108.1 putative alpha crystallin/Hsp20 domain, HSP20-like chaperone [Helianthus annuus]KAJ0511356.1 putative alpha crystallin/Hsp20 domain, HSP20-like chaperone [Helianthus annuus]KAJ0519077.1 putative alpha crystallin/Hsp20 domain, HSP20-like chaperone [Helianthus annuus]KAJ0687069.1 putative alpha crystallin/Hsp20 domain, HSP20-like chaperone [H
MDSRVGGTQTSLSYDEFDPLCTWQREDGQDILVIHLPDFKKEQLRIQISSSGIMKITGENTQEGKKRSRFVKEVKVLKDYDSSNIHAKFSQGRLRITLPKKPSKPSLPDPVVVTPSPQEDQNDKANTNAKMSSPQEDQNDKANTTDIPDSKSRVGQVLRSKMFTQVMVNVGFVAFVAFSAYTAYKYWTSYVQVDED